MKRGDLVKRIADFEHVIEVGSQTVRALAEKLQSEVFTQEKTSDTEEIIKKRNEAAANIENGLKHVEKATHILNDLRKRLAFYAEVDMFCTHLEKEDRYKTPVPSSTVAQIKARMYDTIDTLWHPNMTLEDVVTQSGYTGGTNEPKS